MINMPGQISNILFVCIGNICRSPFAHGLFNKLTAEKGFRDFNVQSAGLLALPGNAVTFPAQRVANEYSVDLAEHKAQSMSRELVAWSELIIVMEKFQKDMLLKEFPEANGRVRLMRHFARSGSRSRGIADPYGLNYEAYRFCYLDIEDAVTGLIEYLSAEKIRS